MVSRKLDGGMTGLGLHTYEVGGGRVIHADGRLRLEVAKQRGDVYADAQVDDYHADGNMCWRPNTCMTLRARFSHPREELRGTAGFGFWNDPFGMTRANTRLSWLPRLRLPQAIWFFFASPPSNMALARGVPGSGWKAATLDAGTIRAKLLLPLAPVGILACRVPALYERVWPLAQRTLKIAEAEVAQKIEGWQTDRWHEYRLEWLADGARFMVDGEELCRMKHSPRGPLGFVAWMDNQYMIATPQGNFRNGMIACGDQWLEIDLLEISAV